MVDEGVFMLSILCALTMGLLKMIGWISQSPGSEYEFSDMPFLINEEDLADLQ